MAFGTEQGATTPEVQPVAPAPSPDAPSMNPVTPPPDATGQMPSPALPPSAPAPAAATPQAQPQTNRWFNTVKAALEGFAQGGVGGAIAGGLDPNGEQTKWKQMKQTQQNAVDQQSAEVKQQQAEAAKAVSDAAARDYQMRHMDEDHQMGIIKNDETQILNYVNRGIQPMAVIADSTEEALDKAKAMVQSGQVPVVFHTGAPNSKQFVAFNLNDLADSAKSVEDVNKMVMVRGGTPFSNDQWANKNNPALPPAAKAKLIQEAAHFFDPTDPKQLETYQTYLKNAQALSDDTPGKSETVSKLNTAVTNLTSMNNRVNKEKLDLATARANAMNAGKPVAVINPDTQNLTYERAADAIASGAAPAAQGTAQKAKLAQFKDIDTGMDSLDKAISALPNTPFTSSDISKVELALGKGKGVAAANVKAFLGNKDLTPQQQDLVVALTQMNERALSARGLSGQTGSSSFDSREAIRAMVPSMASGDTGMMKKQMVAFRQQMNALKTGVSGVKGADGSPTPNKPTTTPAPSTEPAKDPFAAFGGKAR